MNMEIGMWEFVKLIGGAVCVGYAVRIGWEIGGIIPKDIDHALRSLSRRFGKRNENRGGNFFDGTNGRGGRK